jgi:amidase
LNGLSATEIAGLIRAGDVSPVDILQAHLDEIARLNPTVNAICTLAAERAMASARRAEAAVMCGEPLGPLHGLPIGIKDVTPTAGIRTTHGSPLYADYVPNEDAAVVARLMQAGAIVLAKTNTPEFAAGANTVNKLFGATRNPWNPNLTVGGSTGGGAAALACGMIALAEGTDFGGSLRVPAAFCGVVGLRPTAGLVPSYPAISPWDSGRVHGPLARFVEDVALMLDAMVGLSDLSPISLVPPWTSAAERFAWRSNGKGLRVAYVPDIAGVGVDAEIERICDTAARGLEAMEIEVDESRFSLADGRDAYLVLRGQWMVTQYFDHLAKLDELGPNLRANIESGLKLTTRDVAIAEHVRAQLWHRCRALFRDFDLLLTPTVPIPPFPVEQNYPQMIAGRQLATYIDWVAPTFLTTLCGLPAASVPCGLTQAALPVGLQIIGPRYAEPQILSLAKLIQDMHPIGRPPITRI